MQQLGRNNMIQTAAKCKQMMQAIRAAADPRSAMNMMISGNPQLKQVMEIVNRYGGDPMAAFTAMARENGMDPDEILGMIR